ncbi:MAG TPA: type 1 glutamine amidotransferase domain-containing protein [Chloroflexota bacterium]|nr:type 1 glutamine amidotransferase domain-containing protein [Chloroflexota bacterium]
MSPFRKSQGGQNSLEGKRVAIVVADDFEQVEMTEPRKALEQAGARTVLVAPKAGKVQGFNHDTKADSFAVDQTLDEANPDDFDAMVLPGGALNADFLRAQPKAQGFVRQLDRAGKPVAAICHVPWLLVSAGLVRGRTLTSYHTIQDDIRNAGGTWQDREVICDGNWVTSRQPNDIPAFNREMLALFATPAARRQPVGR